MRMKMFFISLGIFLCSCTPASQNVTENSAGKFKAIEQSSGQVLKNSGEIVQSGVEGLDATWETKAEQQKRGQLKPPPAQSSAFSKDGDKLPPLKQIERNTGKFLAGTGALIDAGVTSIDNSWETKKEQEEGSK